MILQKTVRKYLLTCQEITAFCTQNGWIDNESLEFEIVEQQNNNIIISVKFDEIIMEGAGCIANHVSCFGKLLIIFNKVGEIESTQIL